MKPDPRQTAINILNSLETGRKTLDDIVRTALNRRDLPEKRDRALATTLIYGVLRRRMTLDWVIGQLSSTAFDKIDPAVRTILRVGLYQILLLDRIPDYAAVNSSVNCVKAAGSPHAARYVNGVLRTAIRRRESLAYPDQTADPVQWLSVTRSFPEWMVRRWMDRFGPDDAVRYCDRANLIPPITVRVNTLKTKYARVREALAGEAERVEDGRYSPDAISFYSPRGSVDEMESFINGWFQVQDESAQLVCRWLNPRPGERILDACAGLGGKTGYIAQLMKNQGRVTAADMDGKKLQALTAEMERLGVSIVETRRINWLNGPAEKKDRQFDGVLADCPCSGMGVLRRNPDIKWSASPGRLSRHRQNQVRLLSALADRVRPGGRLLYVVCSTEPEENEQVVERFLNDRKDFDIEPAPADMEAGVRQFINDRGYFTTSVYPHDLDGFFGARLKKKRS
jgi:16S rRNA (cytosine967-C5)-methyltransferase